jgi:hypothetical protein
MLHLFLNYNCFFDISSFPLYYSCELATFLFSVLVWWSLLLLFITCVLDSSTTIFCSSSKILWVFVYICSWFISFYSFYLKSPLHTLLLNCKSNFFVIPTRNINFSPIYFLKIIHAVVLKKESPRIKIYNCSFMFYCGEICEFLMTDLWLCHCIIYSKMYKVDITFMDTKKEILWPESPHTLKLWRANITDRWSWLEEWQGALWLFPFILLHFQNFWDSQFLVENLKPMTLRYVLFLQINTYLKITCIFCLPIFIHFYPSKSILLCHVTLITPYYAR